MDHKKFQKFINLSSPLLITGETGSGKSFLAKKIFNLANIYQEKFITVHLASLKEDLLESELYGYKKGAFTGAMDCRSGYLKDVGRGTLFLDEIGELSLDAQKKLLYLLEEKKFTPVGSTQSVDFLGRIIMATNRNLKQMVKDGLFREDLYYRVSVFEINQPSLRENRDLLEHSINKIFKQLKHDHQRPHAFLSEGSLHFLLHKEWKGNFRELKNTLEYVLIMSEEKEIKVTDFSPSFFTDKDQVKSEVIMDHVHFLESLPCDFNQSLEIFEKLYLQSVLKKHEGRVNETARRLGMSKTTLIQKAKKYQINTLKMRSDASLLAA